MVSSCALSQFLVDCFSRERRFRMISMSCSPFSTLFDRQRLVSAFVVFWKIIVIGGGNVAGTVAEFRGRCKGEEGVEESVDEELQSVISHIMLRRSSEVNTKILPDKRESQSSFCSCNLRSL